MLCGVADDRDGLVCDRCDTVYHHECLGDTVAARASEKWFCSSCLIVIRRYLLSRVAYGRVLMARLGLRHHA